MAEVEEMEIRDIQLNVNRAQAVFIGDYEDRVELFFHSLDHLKQFSEQLNKHIKEVEK